MAPDLTGLLSAVEHFQAEIIGDGLKGKAEAIWGKKVLDSIDILHDKLLVEWETRNQSPLEDDS
jgi:hypothetical protein